MEAAILAVPYDSAQREWRMGRGPGRLLGAGLAEALRARGHAVAVEWVEAETAFPAEVATTFQLARRLSERVRAAAPSFPLVLSGGCFAALGVLGGTGADAVVWLDAHGDLNTPETTRSGFLDGMALATATGRCWAGLAAAVPGFRPVPDDRVVLVGGRDLDAGERALLDGSPVAHVQSARDLAPALDALAGRARSVYLHVDLDVLDPAEARANGFAVPGGLTVEEVEGVVRAVATRFSLVGATLSAYDPRFDPEGRVPAAAVRIAAAVLEAARD